MYSLKKVYFAISHVNYQSVILIILVCNLLLNFFVFRQQRVLTYQVLCSWLAVAGSQSSLAIFSESLTTGILSDIKYDKPSINLIVSLINSIKYG